MSCAGPALELVPLDRSSWERSRVTPANIRDISDPGFLDFNHDLCCQVVFSKAPEPSSTHPIKRRLWTTARFWFSILPESTRERVLHSRYAGNQHHGNFFKSMSTRPMPQRHFCSLFLIGQSSLLGTLIGALPGAGADIAAWGSYGLAQKTSQEPERFGKGSEEGVIAPTSANNAAVAGAWIPALVFGIPGDAVTAIVLGALMVYDIKPGPMVFEQSGGQVQAIFMIALITQCLLLPAGWIGIRTFDRLLKCPRRFILTAVVPRRWAGEKQRYVCMYLCM